MIIQNCLVFLQIRKENFFYEPVYWSPWSYWLPYSGDTISSTGPSVSQFRDFFCQIPKLVKKKDFKFPKSQTDPGQTSSRHVFQLDRDTIFNTVSTHLWLTICCPLHLNKTEVK